MSNSGHNSERDDDRGGYEIPRQLERHIQTIATGLLVAAVVWLGTTVQDGTIKQATMNEKLIQIENQMSRDKDNTYTVRDALKDFQLRDALMANTAARVLALEQYHKEPGRK